MIKKVSLKISLITMLLAFGMSFGAFASDNTSSIGIGIPSEQIEEVGELNSTTVSSTDLGNSLGSFKLTSYCGCGICNGKWVGQPTALGTNYVHGRTIAVDKRVIPLGTWVYLDIPGEGWHKFRAEDTGSLIKGNRIDIYVDAHDQCNQAKYNGVVEVRLSK